MWRRGKAARTTEQEMERQCVQETEGLLFTEYHTVVDFFITSIVKTTERREICCQVPLRLKKYTLNEIEAIRSEFFSFQLFF